jgi:hypothetical protein
MGSNAATGAANTQAAEEAQALAFQKQVYGQTQQNLQPYVSAGQGALSSILGFYGLPGGNTGGASQAFNQFQSLPSYQFPLQQGNLALDRQLASSGLTGSGGALKSAVNYNQGYASQGLSGYLQGLGGIASAGQGAAGTIGQQGNQAASTLGQGYQYTGNALGQGMVQSASQLNNGITGALPGLIGGTGGSSYGSSNSGGGLIGMLSNLWNGGSSANSAAYGASMNPTSSGAYGPGW